MPGPGFSDRRAAGPSAITEPTLCRRPRQQPIEHTNQHELHPNREMCPEVNLLGEGARGSAG